MRKNEEMEKERKMLNIQIEAIREKKRNLDHQIHIRNIKLGIYLDRDGDVEMVSKQP